MTWALARAAGWAVLRGLGADHRWPWRVAELVEGGTVVPARRQVRPAEERNRGADEATAPAPAASNTRVGGEKP